MSYTGIDAAPLSVAPFRFATKDVKVPKISFDDEVEEDEADGFLQDLEAELDAWSEWEQVLNNSIGSDEKKKPVFTIFVDEDLCDSSENKKSEDGSTGEESKEGGQEDACSFARCAPNKVDKAAGKSRGLSKKVH